MLRSFAVGAVVLVMGCAVPAPAGTNGPLLSSLQVYTAGETVGFVLHLTNVSESPVELNFRSGQSYDFLVREGDRLVWRWSDDQMFTQALRRELLEPGESRRFEAMWRPDSALTGDFTATGVLMATDHSIEQVTRITLP